MSNTMMERKRTWTWAGRRSPPTVTRPGRVGRLRPDFRCFLFLEYKKNTWDGFQERWRERPVSTLLPFERSWWSSWRVVPRQRLGRSQWLAHWVPHLHLHLYWLSKTRQSEWQLDLLEKGTVPVLCLESFLKEVGGQGEPLLLHLLPPLHHLQQHHRPVEVSSKLEHPDVRVFIILPVLPRLHLFRTTTETDVWVDAASSCSLFRLRFDWTIKTMWILWNRLPWNFLFSSYCSIFHLIEFAFSSDLLVWGNADFPVVCSANNHTQPGSDRRPPELLFFCNILIVIVLLNYCFCCC